MSLRAVPLALSDEGRAELGRLLVLGPPRLAQRAQIVLACAEPSAGSNAGVAAELELATDTVRLMAGAVPGLWGGWAGGWRPAGPAQGRPGAHRCRAGTSDPVCAARQDLSGSGAAREDRSGLRRWQRQQGRRGR